MSNPIEKTILKSQSDDIQCTLTSKSDQKQKELENLIVKNPEEATPAIATKSIQGWSKKKFTLKWKS